MLCRVNISFYREFEGFEEGNNVVIKFEFWRNGLAFLGNHAYIQKSLLQFFM